MSFTQDAFVSIDLQLRCVLFGLECIFRIETSGPEVNRTPVRVESSPVKGQPTDLIVHEWMPGKPLIRAVYQGRV